MLYNTVNSTDTCVRNKIRCNNYVWIKSKSGFKHVFVRALIVGSFLRYVYVSSYFKLAAALVYCK